MNEAELLKLLIGLGSPGIMLAGVVIVVKHLLAAHASQVLATQNALADRIKALEEGHKECEAERQRLGNQLVEELRGRARDRHDRRHPSKESLES